MDNRLHKSRSNRVLAGVCGGLGEYFDVDPTFVRLAFVLLAIFHGLGILAYIVLWIVMPRETSLDMNPRDAMRENFHGMREEARSFGQQFRGGRSAADEPIAPGEPTTETDGEPGTDVEATQPFGPADAIEQGPRTTVLYSPPDPHVAHSRQVLAGAILLVLGVLFLLDNLNIFWWLTWGRTWPLILIAVGIFLLYDRSRHRVG